MTNGAVMTKRVLVADDDAVLRTSVVAILRTCGYATSEAGDGEATLARLAEQPVDVLVLDLRMPKKTGSEVLAELSHPPVVIVVSAYAPDKELLDQVGDKIFRYLRKPVPPAKLLEVVEEALAHAGGTI